MTGSKDRPPALRLAKWLCWLGPLLSLLLAFQIERGHIKEDFELVADRTRHQVEVQLNSFELVLEGFANFIAVSGVTQDQQLRAYAQAIRNLYPDIYMFEIASRVESAKRAQFERSMQARGYPDFTIHGFDYADTRQITTVDEYPVYYPIRFIEPEPAVASQVLGLDLKSTSAMLAESMEKSLVSARPQASLPFDLLEGGRGYVIYRPVARFQDVLTLEQPNQPSLHPEEYAMLVIQADKLIPGWLKAKPSYGLHISYRSAAEAGSVGLLEPTSDDQHSLPLQNIWRLQSTKIINSESQPFEFILTKNVHWSDLSLFWILVVTASGSFLSLYAARQIIRFQDQKVDDQLQQQRLYQQANFDPLTALPNINLLMDRAEQAIRMADRSMGKVGICYLDLDKFKQINDSLGHQTGDKALIEIATRLKAALRTEDTAARIHGDEFVILLPDIEDRQALLQVSKKIRAVFDRPLRIAEPPVRLGASLGTALYPDDAGDLEALLHISDKRMYGVKNVNIEAENLSEAEVLATGPS